MSDVFSRDKRSSVMKAVKSKNNKSTELKLISIFKQLKIKGWRRNYKLYGNPDFVFLKHKVIVFADGCFWHGHNCRNTKPKTNSKYWRQKINRNKVRDRLINKGLSKRNWTVFRIWECAILKNKLPKSFISAVSTQG